MCRGVLRSLPANGGLWIDGGHDFMHRRADEVGLSGHERMRERLHGR